MSDDKPMRRDPVRCPVVADYCPGDDRGRQCSTPCGPDGVDAFLADVLVDVAGPGIVTSAATVQAAEPLTREALEAAMRRLLEAGNPAPGIDPARLLDPGQVPPSYLLVTGQSWPGDLGSVCVLEMGVDGLYRPMQDPTAAYPMSGHTSRRLEEATDVADAGEN